MRRRLVISTIAIVLVVLAALAVPIGLLVYDAAERQLETRLYQQAGTIEAAYWRDIAAGRPPELAAAFDVLGPDDGLRITLADDTTLIDDGLTGPTRSATRVASDGARIVVLTDASPLDENFRDQLNVLVAKILSSSSPSSSSWASLKAKR